MNIQDPKKNKTAVNQPRIENSSFDDSMPLHGPQGLLPDIDEEAK